MCFIKKESPPAAKDMISIYDETRHQKRSVSHDKTFWCLFTIYNIVIKDELYYEK